MATLVCEWRNSRKTTKRIAHMRLTGKADRESDISQGRTGVCDEHLRSLDAALRQVTVWRHTRGALKRPAKMIFC
jgi:hypothetical protein